MGGLPVDLHAEVTIRCILPGESSTYLNQWIGVVDVNEIRALSFISSM